VYPIGKPPVNVGQFSDPGVFRYDADSVDLMRDQRLTNDIKVVVKKSGSELGSPVYFPKTCYLQMDGGSSLPDGSPCLTSGRDPNTASYDYTATHWDVLVGRWGGGFSTATQPHFLFGAGFHMWPNPSVEGQDYCTWYDSRLCTAAGEVQIWIY